MIGLAEEKKHGPKVQLLTLTIEKPSPSLGRRQHPTVPPPPQEEKTPERREREEKLKAKRQSLLIFVRFEH